VLGEQPAAPASAAVAARAFGPRLSITSANVSGLRELLSTTSCPLAIARFATAWPMLPLPMNPIVVTAAVTS
jgi:hypothetical protein